MRKKFVALLALVVATCVSGHAWSPSGAFGRNVTDAIVDRSSSAGQQLPAGLWLPVADVNARVSSLVTADLDADGDTDVLATDNSSGSIEIVVWVNEGDGRLARKEPRKPVSSGFAPASSSVSDGQSESFVTTQSDSFAVNPAGAGSWLSLASQPYRLAPSAVPASASLGTLRSRSPPASHRLS